jgi:hypothetical protein
MTTEKRSKPKAECEACRKLHDYVVAERKAGNISAAADFAPPRVTTAKWRVTYRDGVRFQQQADLCARHFADVLDKFTPKGRAVDLTLTKLR